MMHSFRLSALLPFQGLIWASLSISKPAHDGSDKPQGDPT